MKKFIKIYTLTLVCLIISQTNVFASSHREAPLISNDPLADNTDVYAFRSPCDTNKVVLIANYIPFEHPAGGPNWYNFGTNIRYEIHVKNQTATTGDDIVYRFTFSQVNEDNSTFFNIRLGKQNLKTTYLLERSTGGAAFIPIVANGKVPPNNIGPRSIESGVGLSASSYEALVTSDIATATTGETVFAGPRDDPFFVDLGGAFDLGNFRTSGSDGLAKLNVHSLVVEVPITTLQKNGLNTNQATSILDPNFVIGVYATASRPSVTVFDSTGGQPVVSGPWVQVSRLGMPLTNEVVVPIGDKDKWNATITNSTAEGTNFNKYFKNPELALYMDDSQFGPAVPGLSKLRIQSHSLGTYDFRNGKPGLFPLRGNPALDGTALSDANFGAILLPDNVSPRAVDLLPIFQTGVPNLRPYQLATGKVNGPLDPGKPFINNFLPTFGDMLRLNMAVPVTSRTSADFSSEGLVQAAFLGLTDVRFNSSAALQFIPNMDGFPNGRRLEDDVTTIELQAVSGVVLAAIGLWYDDYPGTGSPVTPQLVNVLSFNAGVVKNDTTLRLCFPYEQTPWRAFNGPGYVGPKSSQTLPVTFVDFTAEKEGQNVQLNWSVTNEINNDHYEVEQSTGNGEFVKIGTIKTASGSGINSYKFLDKNPALNKTNFYRIKQVDRDGKFSFSPIRLVKFSENNILTVSPNPATNFIRIYSTQSPVNINVFDNNGKKLITQRLSNGSTQIDISRWSKGIYTVIAESDGKNINSTKIVKQ